MTPNEYWQVQINQQRPRKPLKELDPAFKQALAEHAYNLAKNSRGLALKPPHIQSK